MDTIRWQHQGRLIIENYFFLVEPNTGPLDLSQMGAILRLTPEPWAQVLDYLDAKDILPLLLTGSPVFAATVRRNWHNVLLRLSSFDRLPISLLHLPELHSFDLAGICITSALVLQGVPSAPRQLVRQESLTKLHLNFIGALFIFGDEAAPLCDLFPSLQELSLSKFQNRLTDAMLVHLPRFLEKLLIVPFDSEIPDSKLSTETLSKLPETLLYLQIRSYTFIWPVGPDEPLDAKHWFPPSLTSLNLTLASRPDIFHIVPSTLESCHIQLVNDDGLEIDVDLTRLPPPLKGLSVGYSFPTRVRLPDKFQQGLSTVSLTTELELKRFPSSLTILPPYSGPPFRMSEYPALGFPNLEVLSSRHPQDAVDVLPPKLRYLSVRDVDLLSPALKASLPRTLTQLEAPLSGDDYQYLPPGLTMLSLRGFANHIITADHLSTLPKALKDLTIDVSKLERCSALKGLKRGGVQLKHLVAFMAQQSTLQDPKFLKDLPMSLTRLHVSGGFNQNAFSTIPWMKHVSLLQNLNRLEINCVITTTELRETFSLIPRGLQHLSISRLSSFEIDALSHLPPNLTAINLNDASLSLTDLHFQNLPKDLAHLSLTVKSPLTPRIVSLLPIAIGNLSITTTGHAHAQSLINAAILEYYEEEPRWMGFQCPMSRDILRQKLTRFMGAGK